MTALSLFGQARWGLPAALPIRIGHLGSLNAKQQNVGRLSHLETVAAAIDADMSDISDEEIFRGTVEQQHGTVGGKSLKHVTPPRSVDLKERPFPKAVINAGCIPPVTYGEIPHACSSLGHSA